MLSDEMAEDFLMGDKRSGIPYWHRLRWDYPLHLRRSLTLQLSHDKRNLRPSLQKGYGGIGPYSLANTVVLLPAVVLNLEMVVERYVRAIAL